MRQFWEFIKKILGKPIKGKIEDPPHPSHDFLTFDDRKYQYQGNQNGFHVWHTPNGDGISLHFFSIPPDIPTGKQSIEKLKEATLLQQSLPSNFLVEYTIIKLDDILSIKQIIKIPQEPHGMTYLGSFIIPFKDFSFVLKVECPERGTTGTREAELFAKSRAKRKVSMDYETEKITGDWNPDAEKYDKDFPHHPISRLRQTLNHLEESVAINAEVKNQPRFPLPEK
jgi:hypothetical protein